MSAPVKQLRSLCTPHRQCTPFSTSPSSACCLLAILGYFRPYGRTRKGTLLVSVPPGVTTCTLPVVAPAGTVVVMNELETTSKTAGVPLNVTLVAPVRLVPRILTLAPNLEELGCGSTNGPR